ncbi:MAG: YadA C-terminal domain-containing protein [Acinetobacter populi]|jgi:hypothetical protein|uniref:YadA C-terminal domain-containing protein n=1 Tax=Acinetobacter populi TaxID=1582270 RepID=UPI0023530A18|nr:YadA C-terminal domain-containing protein [Acinetobacter populi]MCH4247070.1 YadA C-terminal domain-containing protein [Acinetobacter populi]
MKKTLLALSLTMGVFAGQTYAAQVQSRADVYQYANAQGNKIVKVEVRDSSNLNNILSTGYYTVETNGSLTAFTGDTTAYAAVLGGQVDAFYEEGDVVTDHQYNNTNDYWAYSKETTNGFDFQLNGQLVDSDGEVLLNLDHSSTGRDTVTATKDVEIGNLTRTGQVEAVRNFTLSSSSANAQGLLARNDAAVTAVTGDGVALVKNSAGAVIDVTKGTSTRTTVTTGAKDGATVETKAYRATNGAYVYKIGNDYYTASNGTLTAFTGDTSSANLTQYAAGVADKYTNGVTTKSVDTAFVGNTNVTYGESVSTQQNAGTIKLGSTDPNWVQDAGDTYTVGAAGDVVETSKSVVTGIIDTNETTGNTYGLEATTTKDGIVTDKTTITAAGISTTGTINASDYQVNGVSITESLNNAVTQAQDAANGVKEAAITQSNTYTDTREASIRTDYAAADAKTLTEANAYTDAAVSSFQSNVNRISKKLDDVEKTAYRGVAIALAAQQQVPNIKPGQFAVFGGVGHYEGESAGALGLVSALADGRTSISAALGVAGSGEVGGRVGVAYVFGGN